MLLDAWAVHSKDRCFSIAAEDKNQTHERRTALGPLYMYAFASMCHCFPHNPLSIGLPQLSLVGPPVSDRCSRRGPCSSCIRRYWGNFAIRMRREAAWSLRRWIFRVWRATWALRVTDVASHMGPALQTYGEPHLLALRVIISLEQETYCRFRCFEPHIHGGF